MDLLCKAEFQIPLACTPEDLECVTALYMAEFLIESEGLHGIMDASSFRIVEARGVLRDPPKE